MRSEAPLAPALASGWAVAITSITVTQRASIYIIFLEAVVVVGVAEVPCRVCYLPDHILRSHLLAQGDSYLSTVRQPLCD